MISFFADILHYPFLRYAVIACLLAALPAGIIGSQVLIRRSTYLAGAIAHCVLAGIGLAVWLQRACGIEWFTPTLGAGLAAVSAALLLGGKARKNENRPDAVANALWVVGMAVGVSFMAATPGYQTSLASYLFGNILMVGPAELKVMVVLNLTIVAATILFYNRFLAIGFNRECVALRGVDIVLYERLFLVLTALTIVLLVQLVGIVLALALLTLPAATASLMTRRLAPMMLIAGLLSFAASFAGIGASYAFDWPSGATIAEISAALYALAFLVRRARRRFRRRA